MSKPSIGKPGTKYSPITKTVISAPVASTKTKSSPASSVSVKLCASNDKTPDCPKKKK